MLIVAPLISAPLSEMLWDGINGTERLTEEDEWAWQIELLQKIPIHFIVTDLGLLLRWHAYTHIHLSFLSVISYQFTFVMIVYKLYLGRMK